MVGWMYRSGQDGSLPVSAIGFLFYLWWLPSLWFAASNLQPHLPLPFEHKDLKDYAFSLVVTIN